MYSMCVYVSVHDASLFVFPLVVQFLLFICSFVCFYPNLFASYCHGQWQTVSEFQHSSESVAVGNFVYKSWLARRAYCSRPPTGRFQAHHFQAIMNFLLKAVTPR